MSANYVFNYVRKDDSLESIRARVEASTRRPALITGAAYPTRGAVYRKPNDDLYRMNYTPLEFFLTTFETGPAVQREGDRTFFDLTEASHLKIAVPLRKGESTTQFSFGVPGVAIETSAFTVTLWEGEAVPEGLQPYVFERYNHRQRRSENVLLFALSKPFIRPDERHDQWHLDYKYKGGSADVTSIRPPGHYAGTIGTLMDFNSLAVYEDDPGNCAVCAGASGERKHLGFVRGTLGGTFPSVLICKGCARESFNQILDLL